MFFHRKELQYHAKPDAPNPLLAKRLQELIGGQFGEITVMMQYLMQGWNCRGPMKYRDIILDFGTEEIGHVEMLTTMVGRLLEGAPVKVQEDAAQDPVLGAVMGGMNPQHAIVAGAGAMAVNSAGVPWSGGYIVASGNLMADFRANLNAESQGRLQACRIWEMTDDHGVKDMLAYLIARDTMHQNQWAAAIEELKADGLEGDTVPSSFPESKQHQAAAYQFWNLSQGTESSQGRWAQGPSPDGKGRFEYLASPEPQGEAPHPTAGDARLFNTPRSVAGQMINTVEEKVKRTFGVS